MHLEIVDDGLYERGFHLLTTFVYLSELFV